MDGSDVRPYPPDWDSLRDTLDAGSRAFKLSVLAIAQNREDPLPPRGGSNEAFFIILPLLIVLSTFLFLLLLFLLCVILLRRRRGIALRDHDGPVDMSRDDLIDGEGGFEGVESRWLESVNEHIRRGYLRAKEYQLHYPANSAPTDITLSQFLSIQEKGVSAWSFEPDFEAMASMLVHARTEITFLPDPSSASSVQSNLPLPKLNEVYYWEVKMFDLPETTNVAVGLATKPYPSFRLPGHNRYSVAYHSNGDKSHNYPFTSTPFGAALKEGDVLGVGYRPRTGTVFFTRNGRKTEDAFIGLNTWNLFPTIGADGPCSVHVNLGQSGFVFIEANVKKWGLAPSVGTLAPPPAYGSERGSILLQAGGEISPSPSSMGSPAAASSRSRRSHRSRRPRSTLSTSAPIESSPLVRSPLTSPSPPDTPPPPITPIEEEPSEGFSSAGPSSAGPSTSRRYVSPTDLPFHTPLNISNLPSSPTQRSQASAQEGGEWSSSGSDSAESSRSPSRAATAAGANPFNTPRRQPFSITHARTGSRSSCSGSELAIQVHPPPDSPQSPEPPTPNLRDIHLQALAPNTNANVLADPPQRDPPAYSPLDAFAYSEGVQLDLPAEVIAAALETGTLPNIMMTPPPPSSSRTHRSRRDRDRR
ncbi:SPRY-domain-containing protein [Cristinia sonorae]|uniref:SPRY-domain-containing protein n=1 Tax=Cristinia sonorae TaxID=1940300 RepID=A0A8K0UU47_9AGAR|nr:SPRY-domain-containing protein [Cristinia sonorae]